ncbi:MAG: glycosyltransferase family 39 protein [Chloroflexi bacterium]|nr:glycosyltransferase family 39 protein [Chloroflexota bacterium]
MASLYWIEAALAGLLPTVWMFLGLGLPWSLAALSHRRWHSKAMVGATALALGPALMTAWMLILGLLGAQLEARLLTPAWILAGSAAIAGGGCLIAWRKRRQFVPNSSPAPPLFFDEKLIIGLITIAVALRWLHTAFWTFTAYDALWVFGYQGRLYFLEGLIPNTIDYYPPFLSLQFAYVQTLAGEINDQAARMVIPMLHIGSILAAYLLGQGLVNRRAGLICAALWSLHPYIGLWSTVGDLEIPLTFGFTMAAVFFLRAWNGERDPGERRHEALLAGLMTGIALFTKPTAGAFIWGLLLLLAVDLILKRFDLRRWRPRLALVCWTLLACLPLGAVWYLRNLALGHDAITFPKAIWLTRALRSGDFLAPLLVALLVAFVALTLRAQLKGRALLTGTVGIALLAAGALASSAWLSPQRVDPPASSITASEAALIVIGLGLIGFSLRRRFATPISPGNARLISAGGWALLLALPYFVTFYYSYSYHFRLGFAVWPLLCLPTAIALSLILSTTTIERWRRGARRGYCALLCCLSLPGVAAVATDLTLAPIWLLNEELDSDIRKYQYFNPSLIEMVFGLRDYTRDTGAEPVVLAPGEERLPFFFPQTRILDEPVTRLADYDALGATHFIFGAKAREAYREAGLDPLATQLIAALGRIDMFRKAREHHDGNFSYELYQSLDISARHVPPSIYAAEQGKQSAIIFDNRIHLWTQGAFPPVIFEGTPITLDLAWRALEKLDRRLEFMLRMQNADTKQVAHTWKLPPAAHRHGEYATIFWEVDEFVFDRHILWLDDEADIAREGQEYVFAIGLWDPQSERFLPVEIDGASAGDFYQLPGAHRLRT